MVLFLNALFILEIYFYTDISIHNKVHQISHDKILIIKDISIILFFVYIDILFNKITIM